jgi:hypothetical protein
MDTRAFREGFLFSIKDEPKLARMMNADGNKLFDFPPVKIMISFLDTADMALENNHLEASRMSATLPGAQFGGIDVRRYNTDNVWETQTSRLIGWDSKINDTIFVDNPEIRKLNDLTGPVFPIHSYESPFDVNGADICIERTIIPMTGRDYIRFFTTTAGRNFRPIMKETDDKKFALLTKEFERTNFIRMLSFIETAYSTGVIEPLADMPAVMIRKDAARFG